MPKRSARSSHPVAGAKTGGDPRVPFAFAGDDRRHPSGEHDNSWKPRAAGIELTPIEGAPRPAGSAAQRLVQMRALARDFSASTRDAEDRRWELRLLSQPLYRYESTDPDVPDGALFAFVTSAGTDPEGSSSSRSDRLRWRDAGLATALARFTDLELSVQYKGKEVLSTPMIRGNMLQMYPKQQYSVFADRVIPDIPAASAQGATP